MNIKKIQKKIFTRYGDRVTVSYEDGIIRLSGELDSWEDIVDACTMAAQKYSKTHVVNDIKLKGLDIPKMRVPSLKDDTLEGKKPDVLVIGGGISGCAIARELTKWNINVMLIEKESDFAKGASGANDGQVHVGVDLSKGSLKQKYVLLGNRMYADVCKDLDVPFERTGQMALFTQPWLALPVFLLVLYRRFVDGVSDARFVTKRAIQNDNLNISPDAKFAMYNDLSGIVCPYGITIAYAENAAENGAEVYLNTAVLSMDTDDSGNVTAVHTNRGTIHPKIVVNAAGVFSDEVANMANDRFYSIHPRRGTNSILDKKVGNKVNATASYQEISLERLKSHSKGGGLLRTVHKNILAGPDAVECFEKENTATNPESIKTVFNKQKKTVPSISERDIITYFTGVRAPTFEEDFILEWGRKCKNMYHCSGIQSPGLTAAPAFSIDVAQAVADRLGETMDVSKNASYNPVRHGVTAMSKLSPEERAGKIAENPDYGIIICRCEEISKGEIIDALNRPLCPPTVDAVKRRIRPGMGRCQGGFCMPLVTSIIAEHEGIKLSEVKKSSSESVLLYGETKGGADNA